MSVPAHFSNRWQKYERKITSAEVRAQNAKFYILEISWKLFAGKFLGNYMLGNFLETISPDGNYVLGNSGGYQRLFDGGNYGKMLWHHTTVSRQWYLELC